jgi:hypothetical protein
VAVDNFVYLCGNFAGWVDDHATTKHFRFAQGFIRSLGSEVSAGGIESSRREHLWDIFTKGPISKEVFFKCRFAVVEPQTAPVDLSDRHVEGVCQIFLLCVLNIPLACPALTYYVQLCLAGDVVSAEPCCPS